MRANAGSRTSSFRLGPLPADSYRISIHGSELGLVWLERQLEPGQTLDLGSATLRA